MRTCIFIQIVTYLDIEIEFLLAAKLIQKIEFLHFKFYAKNPYPHNHIFDHKSLTLKDHDSVEHLFDHQKLINTKQLSSFQIHSIDAFGC